MSTASTEQRQPVRYIKPSFPAGYSYTQDQRMEYRQEMLYYFWMANQEM